MTEDDHRQQLFQSQTGRSLSFLGAVVFGWKVFLMTEMVFQQLIAFAFVACSLLRLVVVQRVFVAISEMV